MKFSLLLTHFFPFLKPKNTSFFYLFFFFKLINTLARLYVLFLAFDRNKLKYPNQFQLEESLGLYGHQTLKIEMNK